MDLEVQKWLGVIHLNMNVYCYHITHKQIAPGTSEL